MRNNNGTSKKYNIKIRLKASSTRKLKLEIVHLYIEDLTMKLDKVIRKFSFDFRKGEKKRDGIKNK